MGMASDLPLFEQATRCERSAFIETIARNELAQRTEHFDDAGVALSSAVQPAAMATQRTNTILAYRRIAAPFLQCPPRCDGVHGANGSRLDAHPVVDASRCHGTASPLHAMGTSLLCICDACLQ